MSRPVRRNPIGMSSRRKVAGKSGGTLSKRGKTWGASGNNCGPVDAGGSRHIQLLLNPHHYS
jgi:hypothetical protein